MAVKSAKGFLKKIKQGEPINYPRFLSWIKTLDLPYKVELEDIRANKLKGNSYVVEILSSRLTEDLEKFSSVDISNRASLATQNKSHLQKVAGSMMVCRKGIGHPQVIIFDENNKYTLPCSSEGSLGAGSCLIIENQQNFLSIKQTLKVLNKDTQCSFEQDTLSIFASGKAISNSIHQEFLSQFSDVYLFLDLDLGGLEIASSLKKILPNQNLVFLVTEKTQEMLENVVSIKTPNYLKAVEDIRQKHSFLYDAASLILNHRKVIEQEAYLND